MSSALQSGANDSVVRRLRGSEDGSSVVSTVLGGGDSLVETVSLIEKPKICPPCHKNPIIFNSVLFAIINLTDGAHIVRYCPIYKLSMIKSRSFIEVIAIDIADRTQHMGVIWCASELMVKLIQCFKVQILHHNK